jgi:cyclophilin family peptidyl-prolyl cis-trans isomerase
MSFSQALAADKIIEKTKTKVPPMPTEKAKPVIIIETSAGTIKAELWPDKAPLTVKSFLKYIDEDYYNGTIFHRVIKGFMIQGGGFTEQMVQKKTHAPVKNEAKSDVGNDRGTLAMARTSVVDSATSQFFINLVDNTFLNHKNETAQGFGYCVFGKVTEGLDIVDKIGQTKTKPGDVPVETIVIKSIKLASE